MLCVVRKSVFGVVPAAGYRNGDSLNNVGNNGNYWSSSLNSNNTSNARNLNFNDSNINTNNNNNRYYGRSVRPVTEFIMLSSAPSFRISKPQLLLDLYVAYKDARRHKRNRIYQLEFECNLESELVRLRDLIWSRKYSPGPSTCFIIHDPKMREVFAAEFRDRVVHHLLYNYIAPFLESGFIEDSYSCIKGRGTHYGIARLKDKLSSISGGYSRSCYVLKLDIAGYFMHIDRGKLLGICLSSLEPFRDRLDFPLVEYLLRAIILDVPTKHCIRRGAIEDWVDLPLSKSLFHSPFGCGLPIGNLTSQLFSNVYLNQFDQYMVSTAGSGRYGRYVDDSYIVGNSKRELRSYVKCAQVYLNENLGLSLSRNKVAIYSAYRGVEFLGAYLKPFRQYVSSRTLKRMENKIRGIGKLEPVKFCCSVNSFLGITSHYRAYNIRLRWIKTILRKSLKYGHYTNGVLKFVGRSKVRDGF